MNTLESLQPLLENDDHDHGGHDPNCKTEDLCVPDYILPASLAIMTGLLAFTYFFEKGAHKLEHLLHKWEVGDKIMEHLYKELTVLGLISFSLFLVLKFATEIDHTYVELFENVHIIIFVTAVFYVLCVAILLGSVAFWAFRFKKMDTKYSFTEAELNNSRATGLAWGCCSIFVPTHLITPLIYHKLKRDFYRKNQITPAFFEFHKYLRRCMQADAAQLIEIGSESWFIIVFLLGVSTLVDALVEADTPTIALFASYPVSLMMLTFVLRVRVTYILKKIINRTDCGPLEPHHSHEAPLETRSAPVHLAASAPGALPAHSSWAGVASMPITGTPVQEEHVVASSLTAQPDDVISQSFGTLLSTPNSSDTVDMHGKKGDEVGEGATPGQAKEDDTFDTLAHTIENHDHAGLYEGEDQLISVLPTRWEGSLQGAHMQELNETAALLDTRFVDPDEDYVHRTFIMKFIRACCHRSRRPTPQEKLFMFNSPVFFLQVLRVCLLGQAIILAGATMFMGVSFKGLAMIPWTILLVCSVIALYTIVFVISPILSVVTHVHTMRSRREIAYVKRRTLRKRLRERELDPDSTDPKDVAYIRKLFMEHMHDEY